MSIKNLRSLAPFLIIGLFLIVAPSFLGAGAVGLITKILIFTLLTMGLDLVFGYTNLWSFAHAGLFGVGAYSTGILIKHYGITSFWVSAPLGVLLTVICSAIFCAIALRGRLIYFLLITLALGQIIYSVAMKWNAVTGGVNGLAGISYPEMGVFFHFTPISYYYFTLTVVAILAYLLYRIVKSPFGVSLQGIKGNEVRMRILGYNTWLLQFAAFLISGMYAGIAGVLYIHYNGLIAPSDVGFQASGLLMLMIIIGGTGTLWGAAIGSTIFMLMQYYVSLITPERWPFIIGIVFIAVVMFSTGGILPTIRRHWGEVQKPWQS
ncbi:MAG: branched-chain amino acid ABC transporter permease [Dehalococcoidales bacterium]|nr:branched-chain amino acid ABC transporter permease [Dehalococcoidales bacterium]